MPLTAENSATTGAAPEPMRPRPYRVETVLRERAFQSVSHEQLLEMLRRYGSMDAALARASEYAEAARTALAGFPDSELRRALLWIPDFVVARSS